MYRPGLLRPDSANNRFGSSGDRKSTSGSGSGSGSISGGSDSGTETGDGILTEGGMGGSSAFLGGSGADRTGSLDGGVRLCLSRSRYISMSDAVLLCGVDFGKSLLDCVSCGNVVDSARECELSFSSLLLSYSTNSGTSISRVGEEVAEGPYSLPSDSNDGLTGSGAGITMFSSAPYTR